MDDVAVLPNGQCYSRAGLERLAQQRRDGKVVCPVTQQVFAMNQVRKAFVL